jgi:hypothetical protein
VTLWSLMSMSISGRESLSESDILIRNQRGTRSTPKFGAVQPLFIVYIFYPGMAEEVDSTYIRLGQSSERYTL